MSVIRARCSRCRQEFKAETTSVATSGEEQARWDALVARYQFGASRRAHSDHAKRCAGTLERVDAIGGRYS